MNEFDVRSVAPGLQLAPEGWWTSQTISSVSYPKEGNDMCFSVEDSSYWFQHRNHCIVEMVRRFPPCGALFDIGGGNGYVARALQDSGMDVLLIEPGVAGARNALARGVRHVVLSTLHDAGLLAETVPAAGLFDVIEHIQDDLGFMKETRELLRNDGRLYLTVPAHQRLWSGEDISAGHWRRYTVSSLRDLLRRAGYEVEYASYFFGFLVLPVFLFRTLPYHLGVSSKEVHRDSMRSDHETRSPVVRALLDVLTRREMSKLNSMRALHVGTSCVAVARKH